MRNHRTPVLPEACFDAGSALTRARNLGLSAEVARLDLDALSGLPRNDARSRTEIRHIDVTDSRSFRDPLARVRPGKGSVRQRTSKTIRRTRGRSTRRGSQPPCSRQRGRERRPESPHGSWLRESTDRSWSSARLRRNQASASGEISNQVLDLFGAGERGSAHMHSEVARPSPEAGNFKFKTHG